MIGVRRSAPATAVSTLTLDAPSMESVIARLLSDFETGKMTRRQLVQSEATVDVNGIGGIIIRNRRQGRGGQAPTGAPTARPDSAAATAATAQPSRPPITAVIDHISWGIEPWDTETVQSELV